MIQTFKTILYSTKVWHASFKNRNELRHWKERRESIIKWYRGEQQYLFPFPTRQVKVLDYDEGTNALLTFINVENNHASYLSDLLLRKDSFEGMKVADIGSGPFPTLLVFEKCKRYCVDHLIEAYKAIGFPLALFESEIEFLDAKSEALPAADGFFDALISRNALDHVDDFKKTAQEIRRVLKADGVLHILVNYHQPTATEPHVLCDQKIQQCFDGLGMRKLSEVEGAWGFDSGRTVLWSNAPERMLRHECGAGILTAVIEAAVTDR
ncbi:MAG: class I SAM-dependent methyltransferase [Limisphaerales bacterium]